MMGLADELAGSVHCDQGTALYGWSVASAGDVNGDLQGDLVMGAIFFTDGQNDEGAAFAFCGSAT